MDSRRMRVSGLRKPAAWAGMLCVLAPAALAGAAQDPEWAQKRAAIAAQLARSDVDGRIEAAKSAAGLDNADVVGLLTTCLADEAGRIAVEPSPDKLKELMTQIAKDDDGVFREMGKEPEAKKDKPERKTKDRYDEE